MKDIIVIPGFTVVTIKVRFVDCEHRLELVSFSGMRDVFIVAEGYFSLVRGIF